MAKSRGGAGRSGRSIGLSQSERVRRLNDQQTAISQKRMAIYNSAAYQQTPLKGYYNAKENKRRTIANNAAKAQLAALDKQYQILQRRKRASLD